MRVRSGLAILAFVLGSSSFAKAAASLEFKMLVDPKIPSSKILQALRYRNVLAQRSSLYFYDTPELKLLSAGLLIRGRDLANGRDELNVKARSLEADDLDPSWLDVVGFDCGTDATALKAVPFCHVRGNVAAGSLEKLSRREISLDDVFSEDQKYFAIDFGAFNKVASTVVALGPIESWRWRAPTSSKGWRIDAEYWRLPDGREFVELSAKGVPANSAELRDAIEEVITKAGLAPGPFALNKVTESLKYFAARAAVKPPTKP